MAVYAWWLNHPEYQQQWYYFRPPRIVNPCHFRDNSAAMRNKPHAITLIEQVELLTGA